MGSGAGLTFGLALWVVRRQITRARIAEPCDVTSTATGRCRHLPPHAGQPDRSPRWIETVPMSECGRRDDFPPGAPSADQGRVDGRPPGATGTAVPHPDPLTSNPASPTVTR